MKKTKTIRAILLSFVLLLAFTAAACGGKAGTDKKAAVVGDWDSKDFEEGFKQSFAQTAQGAEIPEVFLRFKESGEVEYVINGKEFKDAMGESIKKMEAAGLPSDQLKELVEKTKMIYSVKDNEISMKYADGSSVIEGPYEIKEDKMTVKTSSGDVYFTKHK